MATDPTSGTPPLRSEASDPGSQSDVTTALEQGVLKFMAMILQNAQSDVTAAINDTTSEPDSVG